MLPTVDPLPAAPNRNMPEQTFVEAVNTFLAALVTMVDQLNAVFTAIPAEVMGIDYNATSGTSVAIGTGLKTFTIEQDKLLQVGQAVRVANTPTPTNYMDGVVQTYNAATGELVVSVAAVGGSGTHSAWTISLAPISGGLALSGGVMTGLLKTVTPAAGQEAFVIPPGAAPTSAQNGSIWPTALALFARIGGVTEQLSAIGKAETLLNKTLASPIITGCIVESSYSIVDGAQFEIDPANGAWQAVTLGANRTPRGSNFANGQSVTLLVDDGTARTLTWTDASWGGSGIIWLGGGAPPLATTGLTWIVLMKRGNQVYGSWIGYTP